MKFGYNNGFSVMVTDEDKYYLVTLTPPYRVTQRNKEFSIYGKDIEFNSTELTKEQKENIIMAVMAFKKYKSPIAWTMTEAGKKYIKNKR